MSFDPFAEVKFRLDQRDRLSREAAQREQLAAQREERLNALIQSAAEQGIDPGGKTRAFFEGRGADPAMIDFASEVFKAKQKRDKEQKRIELLTGEVPKGLPELGQLGASGDPRGAKVFADRVRQIDQALVDQPEIRDATIGRISEQIEVSRIQTKKEELKAKRAEIAALKGEVFKNEKEMRGEVLKRSLDFIDERNSFFRVRAAALREDAAGDLALVNGLQKMLDPGVSVRVEEFRQVAKAQGVPDRIINKIQNFKEGTILGPKGSPVRKGFVKVAETLFRAAQKRQAVINDDFRSLAKRKGLNPENVVIGIAANTSEIPLAPEEEPGAFFLEFEKGTGAPLFVRDDGSVFADDPDTGPKPAPGVL
jgi:hypothetical protein